MLSRPVTPLTIDFPKELNQLILSYLPPRTLHKIIYDESNFEDEFYLQIPARKQAEETYAILIDNLNKILEKIPDKDFHKEIGEDISNSSKTRIIKIFEYESNREAYEILCINNESKLLATIKSYKLPDSPENIAFIRDCIMHYCYRNQEKGEKLLAELMREKCNPLLLECFIAQDLHISEREYDPSKSILYVAIKNNVPTATIQKLIEYGMEHEIFMNAKLYSIFLLQLFISVCFQSVNGEYKSAEFNFYITPLLIATLSRQEDELISLLIKHFPNQVTLALEALNQIAMIKPGSPQFSYDKDEKEIVCVDKKMAQASKIRLLKLLDKDHQKAAVPLHSADKNEIFDLLKIQLKEAKSLDECKKIYDQHINACYINNAYRPRLDSFICAITGSDKRYTNTKKCFIELLREKMYYILVSLSFVRSFDKSYAYYKACQNELNHPVFADECDKYGVATEYKKKLQARILEIEKTLQLNNESKLTPPGSK